MKAKIKVSLGHKLAVLIILISLVLCTTALTSSYFVYKNWMNEQYATTGRNLVKTLASQLDPDGLDRYFSTQKMDEEYHKTQRFLLDLTANNDVEYLYVVRPHGVGVTFLFDSDMKEGGEYESGGYCALGSYVDLVGQFATSIDQFLVGEEIAPIIQQDASFGWLMTVASPVLHPDGTMAGYVMADINMNQVVQDRQNFLVSLAALMVGLAVTSLVACLLVIRKSIVMPIKLLTKATDEFLLENKEELLSGNAVVNVPEIKTRDELEHLALSFRKMEEGLINYIRDLMSITAEKERIGAELSVATQIQADMLPRIFPAFPERGEFDIFATMNPAKEVGGDFYDYFLLDEDHLAIVVADVSGKGVPAALFMVIAKTLIKNHAQNGVPLGSVFTNTNEQLCEGNDAGLFVTAWMGLLEISTGQFSYVNAGHNPPLLKRKDGSFEYLKLRPGFVLAGMKGMKYRENTLVLCEGDRLFLYTDGVTEATNVNQELFGEERLQGSLNALGDVPSKELLSGVMSQIELFVGDEEQFDDITMLGLEYSPKRTIKTALSQE